MYKNHEVVRGNCFRAFFAGLNQSSRQARGKEDRGCPWMLERAREHLASSQAAALSPPKALGIKPERRTSQYSLEEILRVQVKK